MDQNQGSAFCPNCGAPVASGAAFCPNCGAARAPQQPQQPPQGQYQNQYQSQPQNPQGQYQQNYQQPQYAQPQNQYQNQYQNLRGQYQQPYGQPQYAQPQQGYYPPAAPVAQLKTNRSLALYILLSIITCGIYGIVAMSSVSTDINVIASRYDGKKTAHYCLMVFLLSWLTLGIYPLVWYHKLSNRIGAELKRRGINYSFGAGSFWGWYILGALIVVGPFVYTHKLFKSMNLLSENFNRFG